MCKSVRQNCARRESYDGIVAVASGRVGTGIE
jgi:hypothetical protein